MLFREIWLSLAFFLIAGSPAVLAADTSRAEMDCGSADGRRAVCADVAALDQMLVYNRFGSHNPFGMMFALRRDLSDISSARPANAEICDGKTGAEKGSGRLRAGEVRLKDCKRPRPLVLRANVGDRLTVRLTNYLMPEQPGYSETFCPAGRGGKDIRDLAAKCTGISNGTGKPAKPGDADWPRTRSVNFAIQGLALISWRMDDASKPDKTRARNICLGLQGLKPNEAVYCTYDVDREGTYFLSSKAAPSGGQGDGGSITHGLFGAVVAEPKGSSWYRSQVSRAAFDRFWTPATDEGDKNRHARQGSMNYEVTDNGVPVLNMVQKRSDQGVEIVHTDLNAIVFRKGKDKDCPPHLANENCQMNFREFSVFFHDELKTFYTKNFEELDQFGEGQLAGVRDGFGINYGASGMGAMLLANRKGIGPARDCIECLYEEFFLTSWANGDPALLESYSDDPSNVHHSYLNDRIVFRNVHAGPKETHVFHLHAHQWFAGNDPDRGSYLDSQTVGPEQAFTYDIYRGGLNAFSPKPEPGKKLGWFETLGSGNRNRSPGDSIFHCHLYPHFAQGMWELWRNHDVLEDGTRKLPDGQPEPGWSAEFKAGYAEKKRLGTVDKDGRWLGGASSTSKNGTPIPAIIPLPGEALPLLPTYKVDNNTVAMPGYPFYIAAQPGHRPPQAPMDLVKGQDGGLPRHVIQSSRLNERKWSVPGAEVLETLMTDAARLQPARKYVAKVLAMGDFTGSIESADVKTLGANGEELELAAMGFHYNGKAASYDSGDKYSEGAPLRLLNAEGDDVSFQTKFGAYDTLKAPLPGAGGELEKALFPVNGAPPKPGAPFADPCAVASGLAGSEVSRKPDGEPVKDNGRLLEGLKNDPFFNDGNDLVLDPGLTGFRRFKASAVQLDLITNRAGWHDPQARINVLTDVIDERGGWKNNSGHYKPGGERAVSGNEEPFFFRALSGECIEFHHTNELPKDLELDDFQVRTPTDTIGQHIHLVKFDVMAADGAGNGFNYEDGTFAPDEVAARICAGLTHRIRANIEPKRPRPGAETQFCEEKKPGVWEPKVEGYWKATLSPDRSKQPFQTTVQRWFADPILSRPVGSAEDTDPGDDKLVDRTIRSVFTHDHFGASSIQQHGFYGALLIEPQKSQIASAFIDQGFKEKDHKCNGTEIEEPERYGCIAGTQRHVGASRIITRPPSDDDVFKAAEIHPNYREYALAIADFATLYDPQDYQTLAEIKTRNSSASGGDQKGLERLYCEARHRSDPNALQRVCGSKKDGNAATFQTVPAWVARRILDNRDVAQLLDTLKTVRGNAAGCGGGICDRLAKPVAPPERPESVSVEHHDPYLVNYRGEPIPLRVAGKSSVKDCLSSNIEDWIVSRPGSTAKVFKKADNQCSAKQQLAGANGDMANVFRSNKLNSSLKSGYRDPVTPILEAYAGDRLMLRMIQGAQEVQHIFTIDGYTWPRNIDQRFPAGSRKLELAGKLTDPKEKTQHQICAEKARWGNALEYDKWRAGKLETDDWGKFETNIRECDNLEGRVTGQEIGISEHFEIQGKFRKDMKGTEARAALVAPGVINSTDYHYHFGSTDDLWNGAWGLVRVYQDGNARDMRKPEATTPISDRLKPLPEPEPGTESALVAQARAFDEYGAECNPDVREEDYIYQIAVGVEAREVWRSSLRVPYYRNTFDFDGLFIAGLEPKDLFRDGKANWNNLNKWKPLTRDKVLQAIRRKYAGPKPFSWTLKAGQCARLAVINLLRPQTRQGVRGIRDMLGDALMPKIAPLNTDPTVKGQYTLNAVSGVRGTEQLIPSARLSLHVPLPTLNDTAYLPLPFGWNPAGALDTAWNKPLDPCPFGPDKGSSGKACAPPPSGNPNPPESKATMALLQFYAGSAVIPVLEEDKTKKELFGEICSRLVADGDFLQLIGRQSFLDENINAAPDQSQRNKNIVKSKNEARKQLRRSLESGDTDMRRLLLRNDLSQKDLDAEFDRSNGTWSGCISVQDKKLEILGEGVQLALLLDDVTGDGKRDRFDLSSLMANSDEFYKEMQPIWDRIAAQAVAKKTKWIPYAFGALPVRSYGDIVGHGTHGMFGAINVVPENWNAERYGLPNGTISAETFTAGNPKRRVRQFNVFIQDGLGLRDQGSRIVWLEKNGKTPLRESWVRGSKRLAKLTPDCKVCNDSYDFGEKGVNYMSPAHHLVLRQLGAKCTFKNENGIRTTHPEADSDFNGCEFPDGFHQKADPKFTPTMTACEGEEIIIRAMHPGGRSRQHSFATVGLDYDDLFPGFGFPRAALLAPGKVVTASLTYKAVPGTYLWTDGGATLRSGGIWGLLKVSGYGKDGCPRQTP